MTVIAWDGKTLAADRRACIGDAINITTKVFKIENSYGEKFLCAFEGSADRGEELINWFFTGHDPEKFPANQKDKEQLTRLCVICKDGEIWLYDQTAYPIRLFQPIFCMGSGADLARAAIHCGKTAKEAVEIASLYNITCGNGVDVLTHD